MNSSGNQGERHEDIRYRWDRLCWKICDPKTFGGGHEVLILSRSAQKAKESVPWAQIVEGDPQKAGDWQRG